MKLTRFILPAALLMLMSSCLKDDDDNSGDWQKLNEAFVTTAAQTTIDGKPEYTRVTPSWAPDIFILMKWENDRSKNSGALKPLDNSTVDLIYSVTDIKGNLIDSSHAATVHGDSIYRTQPCKNIAGFWTAVTNMRVGDKTKVVIPYNAGYGTVKYGAISAYSTLIYKIELRGIPGYQVKE